MAAGGPRALDGPTVPSESTHWQPVHKLGPANHTASHPSICPSPYDQDMWPTPPGRHGSNFSPGGASALATHPSSRTEPGSVCAAFPWDAEQSRACRSAYLCPTRAMCARKTDWMTVMASSCPGSPSAWTVGLGARGEGGFCRVTMGRASENLHRPPVWHSWHPGPREPGKGTALFQGAPSLLSVLALSP